MSEEEPVKAVSELVMKLTKGLSQPLVKAWKLKYNIGRHWRAGHGNTGGVSAFIDPRSGLFYARVPEDPEGTLYASETLSGLRADVEPAVEALEVQQRDAAHTGRVWERRIRIWYGRRKKKIGEWGTAKPQTQGRWGRRTALTPPDVTPCVEIGALTFTRYERAMQPEGGRYDIREFTEDYDERARFWRSLDSKEQDSAGDRRPKQHRRVEWVRTSTDGSADGRGHGPEFRDIPYTPENWEMLTLFTRRFEMLDARLRKFLLEMNEDDFMVALSHDAGLLLTGTVAPNV